MVRPESTSSPHATPVPVDQLTARHIYELRVERVNLNTMRAVLGHAASETGTAALEGKLEAIDARLAEVEHRGAPMGRLAARFGLDAVECELVWAAVALAVDPRIPLHAVGLVGSDARRGLSLPLFGLISRIDPALVRALAFRLDGPSPLLVNRFLEVGDAELSATSRTYRPSSRLIAFLCGEEELGYGGRIEVPQRLVFDPIQRVSLERITSALRSTAALVVIVEGPPGSGRRTAVAVAAEQLGVEVVQLDVRRISPSPAALEAALISLRREATMRDAIPVIASVEDLVEDRPDGSGRLRALARFVDELTGRVVLTTARAGLDLDLQRGALRIGWTVADAPTRRVLWQHQLGDRLTGESLDQIAMHYALGAGGIARAAGSATEIARGRGVEALEVRDVVAGIHNNIAEHLGDLAHRIDVKQSWDDLVVSQDVLDQIHALIGRVRHAHRVYGEWGFGSKQARGIGVPVLFSGPPGTGKTMVAGIIARELGLELLQIDLSQVVSKWIGETEKQLSRVFDAAEAGHAVLLFDEADSLFAKRTEVKGSNDRYANLEVNYLLQRVEAFGGITILTTNMDTSIDPALKRRLASHIVFWAPDEDEREELWKRMLTTGSAPLARDLDLAELARLYPDMSGANIRNAVLGAAFLAAGEEGTITHEHLERAARGEYRTMGRVLR